MASLLGLCLLCLTHTAAGLQSSDPLMMFALLGDGVTLPCNIPSIKSCSSINWNMAEDFGSVTDVVTAGRVAAENVHRLDLLWDCSLRIHHLELKDARQYSCNNGAHNSSVALHVLELTERLPPVDDTIELHCFLNTYKGHRSCHNSGIHIKWITAGNTPLNGNRFRYTNPSECFSKLIIKKKLTDNYRKWKCQLLQNDTVKASISYTTTVKDGVEEVFAAVGESVSLSCRNTSSLGGGGSIEWAVGERTLTADISPYQGQIEPYNVNGDSSLVIYKVSTLQAGDYKCSESSEQQKVLHKIRLYTLDVTSECKQEVENLTLTCVLTCSKDCRKDLNLTWSGADQNSRQSSLMSVNNTLIKTLFLPVLSTTSEEITCLVHREGEVMASKRWCTVRSLQTPAWVALPLGLLMCLAAGGLYMYMQRKHRDAGNEQSDIGMTHVYEVIRDTNNEERQPRNHKREAVNTTDSFYDLLQAVN